MNDAAVERAQQLLHAAQRILITSHIRPDGDAVGSVLGLGLALKAAGKQAQMVLIDGVPTPFQHLPGANQVLPLPQGDADLVVVLDSSDMNRLGDVLGLAAVPDLNIDHHVTNLNYARVNLVDPGAVATAAMLAEFIPIWGLSISQPVAATLLTGIITDTLGFRTSNMNADALRISADLIDAGANLPDLYEQALIDHSFEAARYWGAGLSRLQRQGRLVWTTLMEADRREAGYAGRNDADLINFLSTIRDSDVAVIFVEHPDGRVKVSWRARPGYDISQIALGFGGGGHPAAAGAELDGDLPHVQRVVLAATGALLVSPDHD